MRVRRYWRTSSTAIAVAISLVVTIPGVASGEPASGKPKPTARGAEPRKEKSVPAETLLPKAGIPDRDAERTVTSIPEQRWPAAGRAEVAVPKPQAPSAGRTANAVGPMTPAGTLPFAIGPAGPVNKAAAGLTSADRATVAAAPGKVAVELLERTGAELRFTVRRTDGVAKAGQVGLRLDYSAFRQAYGGDWSTRLQVLRLPDCAGCSPVRVPSRNDGTGTLVADVPAAAAPTTFAVAAAPSGPAGDGTATALNPTATWQVGGSSGDFNWSYPMQVPPSLGGPKPTVALGYNSGAVDGRTTASNSQGSWVGAGFELAPGGSIERRYASCGSKTEKKGNNGTTATGDYCWATDNATFSLNGAGGELILDDTTKTWHSRTDDGLKIERLGNADNGDEGPDAGAGQKGEYWRITDQGGVQYFFGLNKLPGASTATNSAWTVPVAGNNGGEPCNKTAFVDSFCQQAYKWQLDYVVDPHGNTMSYYYDVETNRYGRAGKATLSTPYTRAGNINRIEYGQQKNKLTDNAAKVAQIRFETAERCLKTTGCVAEDYVDTPLDQECTSTANCGTVLSPTFWTKKRLARVVSEVWRGTAYAPVDSWSLRQSFLDPKDGGRSSMLWLDGLGNTGHVGGTKSLPEVTFAAQMLPNRLIGPDSIGQPALLWPRVQTVTYGTGGQVAVHYKAPDCVNPSDLPAVDDNRKRCYPIKWTPKDQAERQDWFAKYVVDEVKESDQVGGTRDQLTRIEYPEAPAWRHDEEDGLVEVDRKTWSQWRGYEKVKVITGDGVDGPATVKLNTYYRGMDGDVRLDNSVKDVSITDSTGAKSKDLNALTGRSREQATYSGATIVDRSIADQWVSKVATATRQRPWGTTKAYRVAEQAVRQDQATGSGWKSSSASNTIDEATGRLTQKSDLRDVNDPDDDVCTRYEYFDSPAAGLSGLPARQQTVDVACTKPWTKDDVISDTVTTYDPATGDKLTHARLSGFDAAGKEIYQTTNTIDYDVFGRVRHTKKGAATTTVDYTPATGGPVTATRTTQPNGQTATSTVDPAWGEELSVTDIANRTTTTKRDALGRVLETRRAGNTGAIPDVVNVYRDDTGKPGLVTSTALRADGSTEITRQFSDGLGRRRQTQSESADGVGRIITDYLTDSRGQVVKQNGPYYNNAPLGFEIVKPTDESKLPAQKLTTFDALGRPQVESFKTNGVQQWARTHTNGTGVETIEPPTGEQATTRITDLQGRLVELRAYAGNKATGAYDKTTYAYTTSGQIASVTDPAGNVWSYKYDLRGRKIEDNDPDRGPTTYTYNELDQVLTAKDARNITLTFSYDILGRKTAVKRGDTLISETVYDTIKPGQITSATRYVDGNPYTTRYTGYDAAGRPTGTELVVPASEGNLKGVYPIGTTYTSDGQVKSTTMPGVGGLPQETVTVGYDSRSRPITLTGAAPYVTETDYTAYGETSRIKVENGDNWTEQLFEYEEGSHRLSRSSLLTPNGYASDVSYKYDAAGNVLQATDTPTTENSTDDTQCFGYDHYRRLTQAWTPVSGDCAAARSKDALGGPAPYWYSWTFDAIGNRKTERRITPTTQTDASYKYPAAGQAGPHAVEEVTTTGTGGTRVDKYGYDASGNLTTRTKGGVKDTLTWSDDGRLTELAGNGKSSKYIYDAEGNQILRRDAGGTTLLLGATELLLKPDGSLVGTRYYTLGDHAVAVRVGDQIKWVSSDHHGTLNVSVDSVSLAIQRRRMTPYGEVRGAAPTAWTGQRGFVGGVQDDSTGLVSLGARQYDPGTGRFISADPILDFEDPQQMNAYAYANNSPVTFSDPDGERYVTETVTTLREVVKVVVKRITEERERLVTKSRMVILAVAIYNVFRALGWNALANALISWVSYQVREIYKIQRTIRELVKVQERVTRKLQRWVDDAESKNLDQMLKNSNDILASATRTAQQAAQAMTWALTLRGANRQGGGGGGGGVGRFHMSGGPSPCWEYGCKYPDPNIDKLDNKEPDQPLWYKVIRGGVAGGVGGLTGFGCAAPLTPSGLGAAGAMGACSTATFVAIGGLFDNLWTGGHKTPREKAYDEQRKQNKETFRQYCHTYNGC